VAENFNVFGRKFLARWIDAVCRRAWLVVAVALAAGGGSLYYTATNVRIDARIDQMLSSALPFRQAEIALKAALPKTRNTLAIVVEGRTAEDADEAAQGLADRLAAHKDRFHNVLYAEGLPFFRQNGLLYLSLDELESVSDRLAEAQPLLASIANDPSLRGLADVFDLAVGQADAKAAAALAPAIDKMAEAVEGLAEGNAMPMSWRSLLSGDKAEPLTDRRKFIVVRPVRDLGSLKPVGAAVKTIQAAAVSLGLTADKGIRIRVVGNALMLQEELETVRDGIGFVGLLSFALVLVLLLMGLKSLRLVVAALITLILGLIWTAGFAVVSFGALNIISVAFAVLFIGLSVDFGIHFTLRYREAIAGGTDSDTALRDAGLGVGGALFLSAVTAAFGFLSFLPTDYRGVSELGVISGVGMFIALLANLTVLPALIHLMPLTAGRSRPVTGAVAGHYDAFVKAHAGKIAAAAVAFGIAGAASLPFAWFDDDPLNLRDPRSPSVAALLDVLDDPRAEPYGLEILAKDLDAAERLKLRLKAIPTVKGASTLLDLVPGDQDDKLAVIDDMALVLTPVIEPASPRPAPTDTQRQIALGKLRGSLEKANGTLAKSAKRLSAALDRLPPEAGSLRRLEQVLVGGFTRMRDRLAGALDARPVAMTQVPVPLRERMLTDDGRAIVNVKPAEDLRDPETRRRFAHAVRAVAPTAVGPPVRFTAVGEAVIGAFQEAAAIAFFIIVIFLFFVLRRTGDVAMVLAPIILALLLTVASAVALQAPFNLANIIVLPLILGLGVAFGIQIVCRSRTETQTQLMETSTPRAVLFSALTTTGSFGALAMSNHPGTASMGALLTVAIGFTLCCTLLVLPALLELSARQDRTRA
jgi:hopanoid biosynthesis associated RND transporter like protein HpnN